MSNVPRDLRISELGSFFVGGSLASLSGLPEREVRYARGAPALRMDPNGTYTSGQIYVQYVKLAACRRKFPVVFLSGGTSTGAMWESTPDGRPGWQTLFLSHGFDTFVVDACGRGRASSAPPEVTGAEAIFRPHEETWRLVRIGEKYVGSIDGRGPFQNTQFPIVAFDDFAKQVVPRFAGQEEADLDALRALVRKIGPVLIVAQSSGGYLACCLAKEMPAFIKGVVSLELTAAPIADQEEERRLASVPQCILWGDNWTNDERWVGIRSVVDGYVARLRARGGNIELIDLPTLGMAGNTHQLMMDRNSEMIFERVVQWLEEHGIA